MQTNQYLTETSYERSIEMLRTSGKQEGEGQK